MSTISNTSKLISATLAAALLALAIPAGPAVAAGVTVKDADDTTHGSDLLAMKVRHGEKQIQIRTTHADLQPSFKSGSSGAVYIDTDSSDKGPEYVFVGGYFEGTDYTLVETEGFDNSQWGDVVKGSWNMRIDYDAETVTMTMDRAAVGNPEKIRVAARVAGQKESTVDWYKAPQQFTPWVVSGS